MASIDEQTISRTYNISRAITGELETDFDTSTSDATHLGLDGLISPCIKTTLKVDSHVLEYPYIDNTEHIESDPVEQLDTSRKIRAICGIEKLRVPQSREEIDYPASSPTLLTSASTRKDPVTNPVKPNTGLSPKSFTRSNSARMSRKPVRASLIKDSETPNRVQARTNLRNPLRTIPITPDTNHSMTSSSRQRIVQLPMRSQTHKPFVNDFKKATNSITVRGPSRSTLSTQSSRWAGGKSTAVELMNKQRFSGKTTPSMSTVITPQRTRIGAHLTSTMSIYDNQQSYSKFGKVTEVSGSLTVQELAKDVPVFSISTPLPDSKLAKTPEHAAHVDKTNTRLRIPSSQLVRSGALTRCPVVQAELINRTGSMTRRGSTNNKPPPVSRSTERIARPANLTGSKIARQTKRHHDSRIGTSGGVPGNIHEK